MPTLTGWGPLGFRSSQLSSLLESLVFSFECQKFQQSPGCGPWGLRDPCNHPCLWSLVFLSRVTSSKSRRDGTPRICDPRNCRLSWSLVFLLGGERREGRREKRQERGEGKALIRVACGVCYLCNLLVTCLHSGSWTLSGLELWLIESPSKYDVTTFSNIHLHCFPKKARPLTAFKEAPIF